MPMCLRKTWDAITKLCHPSGELPEEYEFPEDLESGGKILDKLSNRRYAGEIGDKICIVSRGRTLEPILMMHACSFLKREKEHEYPEEYEDE